MRPGLKSIAALAVLAHAVWSSTWALRQDEQGVALLFGRPGAVLAPGLHFTWPWPLGTLRRVSTGATRSVELGALAPTLTTKSGANQWLTGDTNLVELGATVLFTVEDPRAFLFAAAPGEIERLVAATASARVTELLSGLDVDEVLTSGKARLQGEALRLLQRELDALGLGLRLRALNVGVLQPPFEVLAAFEDVQSARSDRERLALDARGSAARLQSEARAEAHAALVEAESDRHGALTLARARAATFHALAAESADAPELVRARVWFERWTQLLGRGRRILVPPAGDVRTTVFLEE